MNDLLLVTISDGINETTNDVLSILFSVMVLLSDGIKQFTSFTIVLIYNRSITIIYFNNEISFVILVESKKMNNIRMSLQNIKSSNFSLVHYILIE